MDLIAIAHPKFKPSLIEEAKKLNLIYKDQAFIPGKKGGYPEHLELFRTTKKKVDVNFRPVKINDEPMIKEFFYSLSDQSLRRRFFSYMFNLSHSIRQKMVVIDYTREMVILAIVIEGKREILAGIGQYIKLKNSHMAEVAFAVRDDYQNKGIGSELLSYITILGKKEGLHGFTADVLVENKPMIHLFKKMNFDMDKKIDTGVYELVMRFGDNEAGK